MIENHVFNRVRRFVKEYRVRFNLSPRCIARDARLLPINCGLTAAPAVRYRIVNAFGVVNDNAVFAHNTLKIKTIKIIANRIVYLVNLKMAVAADPSHTALLIDCLVAQHVDDTHHILVDIVEFHRFIIDNSVQTIAPLLVIALLRHLVLAEH